MLYPPVLGNRGCTPPFSSGPAVPSIVAKHPSFMVFLHLGRSSKIPKWIVWLSDPTPFCFEVVFFQHLECQQLGTLSVCTYQPTSWSAPTGGKGVAAPFLRSIARTTFQVLRADISSVVSTKSCIYREEASPTAFSPAAPAATLLPLFGRGDAGGSKEHFFKPTRFGIFSFQPTDIFSGLKRGGKGDRGTRNASGLEFDKRQFSIILICPKTFTAPRDHFGSSFDDRTSPLAPTVIQLAPMRPMQPRPRALNNLPS